MSAAGPKITTRPVRFSVMRWRDVHATPRSPSMCPDARRDQHVDHSPSPIRLHRMMHERIINSRVRRRDHVATTTRSGSIGCTFAGAKFSRVASCFSPVMSSVASAEEIHLTTRSLTLRALSPYLPSDRHNLHLANARDHRDSTSPNAGIWLTSAYLLACRSKVSPTIADAPDAGRGPPRAADCTSTRWEATRGS